MENENLVKRTTLKTSNLLELNLVIKKEDIIKENYEITRKRPSMLPYGFEQ